MDYYYVNIFVYEPGGLEVFSKFFEYKTKTHRTLKLVRSILKHKNHLHVLICSTSEEAAQDILQY